MAEQLGTNQDCLDCRVEDTQLPPDGYRKAGRQLSNTLSGNKSLSSKAGAVGLVDRLLASHWIKFGTTTLFTVFFILAAAISPFSDWLAATITFISWPPDSAEQILGQLLLWLIAFFSVFSLGYLASRLTTALLKNSVDCTRPRMSVLLAINDEQGRTKAAIRATPDKRLSRIRQVFEGLGTPFRMQEGTANTADLFGVPPGEFDIQRLHITEWTVTEDTIGGVLETDEENHITETDSTNLPLDNIARGCQEIDRPCLVQTVITPQPVERLRLENIMAALEKQQQLAPHRRVLSTLFDIALSNHENLASRQTPDELSGNQQKKYEALDKIDNSCLFEIKIRAAVYGDKDAEGIFNDIKDEIDVTTNESIKLHRHTPTRESAKQVMFERLINNTHTSAPRLRNLPGLYAWKRVFNMRVRHREIVADSMEVWNYCLLSTESGDTVEWRHGSSPRDQQPTDLPPDNKLDQFR